MKQQVLRTVLIATVIAVVVGLGIVVVVAKQRNDKAVLEARIAADAIFIWTPTPGKVIANATPAFTPDPTRTPTPAPAPGPVVSWWHSLSDGIKSALIGGAFIIVAALLAVGLERYFKLKDRKKEERERRARETKDFFKGPHHGDPVINDPEKLWSSMKIYSQAPEPPPPPPESKPKPPPESPSIPTKPRPRSLVAIASEYEKTPMGLKEDFAKHLRGVRVAFHGEIHGVKKRDEGQIKVVIWQPLDLEMKRVNFVWFRLTEADHRALLTIAEGHPAEGEGLVEEYGSFDIELTDVTLTY